MHRTHPRGCKEEMFAQFLVRIPRISHFRTEKFFLLLWVGFVFVFVFLPQVVPRSSLSLCTAVFVSPPKGHTLSCHAWVSLPPLSPARGGITARMPPAAAGGHFSCHFPGMGHTRGSTCPGWSRSKAQCEGLNCSRCAQQTELWRNIWDCPGMHSSFPLLPRDHSLGAGSYPSKAKRGGKIASDWISVLGSAIPGGTESIPGEG